MKIVYDWLKEFVDVAAPATELREKLSLAGVAIDSVEDSPAGPVLDAEVTATAPIVWTLRSGAEVCGDLSPSRQITRAELKESGEKANAVARVEIESPELCGRYTARVSRRESAAIARMAPEAPGSDWRKIHQQRRRRHQLRMFELGEPLHAFDLEKLSEHRIVVRRARPGEKMRTLDGADGRSPTKCA